MIMCKEYKYGCFRGGSRIFSRGGGCFRVVPEHYKDLFWTKNFAFAPQVNFWKKTCQNRKIEKTNFVALNESIAFFQMGMLIDTHANSQLHTGVSDPIIPNMAVMIMSRVILLLGLVVSKKC